ncbi:hypothetical protein BDV96DRAFT_601339 [Lophiotrema nucula]|uniref:Uncharacterized protein n=1 Tax=Lophiotrema nucula TaxID=690887 RepID=A0A6A5Z4Q9_9PLEO|nr:hypothetical protein BDV96DRAFT_601339 [Lophiotrema nucula]
MSETAYSLPTLTDFMRRDPYGGWATTHSMPYYTEPSLERRLDAERTATEVIIKTVAIHIAVIIAAAHLTTIQRASREHTKALLWRLAWSMAVPTYPIASLLSRALRCAALIERRGRRSVNFRYCVAGILGVHAVAKSNADGQTDRSIPLLQADVKDVRRRPQKWTLVWLGRITVCIIFLTQAAGTLVLAVRRLKQGEIGEIDIRNAVVALGGLTFQLIGVLILILNEEWEFDASEVPSDPAVRRSAKYRGPTFKLLMTASVIVNSWYFRFHIKDVYLLTAGNMVRRGEHFSEAVASGTYVSYGSIGAKSLLPNFMWLAWAMLLYLGQSSSELLALIICAFLSLSFPIEELATGTFPRWKDPLSEKLYVF